MPQVSPHNAAVRHHMKTLVSEAFEDPTIAQIRRGAENFGRIAQPRHGAPLGSIPVDVDGVTGEWFVPADADTTKRILYFHGGGWFLNSVDTHRRLIAEIARVARRPVLAIDYRLAPEHAFPKGLEDCATALAWLFDNGPNGPEAARDVAVAGDSSGGNLTAAVTLHALANGGRAPDRIALICPVTDPRQPPRRPEPKGLDDPAMANEVVVFTLTHYTPDDPSGDNPLIAPLSAGPDLLRRFPPTLIQVGSDEFLRDQCVEFAAALWSEDVPVHLSVWPKMPHVWHHFIDELPRARQAIREIVEFFDTSV